MGDVIVLSLKIYGFAVIISLLVAVMIRVIVAGFAMSQASSAEPDTAPVTKPPTAEDVPIAAITAAVYAVVGPHRIVHIRQTARSQDWRTEGRSSHHRSHNIPRRGR